MESLAPRFAAETYKMLDKQSKEKRIEQINKNLSDTGYVADAGKSNRDILYLVNDKTKDVHIAHRGTNFAKKDDVTADVYFALGAEKHNKAFKKRADRTSNLVKEIPDDYTLNMSGHSYGGASSSYAVKNKKNVRDKLDHLHTYNAAFSPFTKKTMHQDIRRDLNNKITHHRVDTDGVSASSLINHQVGNIKTYKAKSKKIHQRIPKRMQPFF